MPFFGIVFVLCFFELSEKPGFRETAMIHFVRGRGSHDVDIIMGGEVI